MCASLLRYLLIALVLTVGSGTLRAQSGLPGTPASQPDVSDSAGDSTQSGGPAPTPDARDRVYYPGDTEGVKPLATKLFKNILLDQREIWTSPFRMQAKDAGWWLGFGGVTAALIATDKHTSTVLENTKAQVAWGNNISKIGASYTLVPLLAGFYSFGVFANDPKARETGVLGTEALVDSLIVSEVLKPIAGRNRPNAIQEQGHFFKGGASFPSGHAIESWTLASVISHEYGHTKYIPVVACTLATLVSVARFGAQQHYASDIVAGGGMGWFIGRYVWKTHQDHAIHPHRRLNAQFWPEVQPSTRTYLLSVSLSR